MRSIPTLYKLTLRSIFRERVALSMLVLLALVLVLLPAGLETDGTAEGAVRMQIRYSLGFSTFLIAAMTLWVSCASIAGDFSSKRLQMLLTKPVSRAAVWWGKWLAVVTLVSGLTFISGGVTWLRVMNRVRNADLPPEIRAELHSRQLTARKPVDRIPEDFSEEAEALAEERIAAGAVHPNATREMVVHEMLRYLNVTRNAVSAGERVEYAFELPEPLKAGETFQLAYQYDGSAMGVGTVPGAWSIHLPGAREVWISETNETPYGDKVIEITVDEKLAGAQSLTLVFENRIENAGRIFFKPDRGIRLFFEGGSFTGNLIRALSLICGMLAILAAIGISTGSAFSLPVACYASAVVLFLQALSGMVESTVEGGPPIRKEGQSPAAHRVEQLNYQVYRGVLVVLKPLRIESPLGRVSGGILVSTGEMLRVMLFRFTPVILLISGVGILVFRRREVGAAA